GLAATGVGERRGVVHRPRGSRRQPRAAALAPSGRRSRDWGRPAQPTGLGRTPPGNRRFVEDRRARLRQMTGMEVTVMNAIERGRETAPRDSSPELEHEPTIVEHRFPGEYLAALAGLAAALAALAGFIPGLYRDPPVVVAQSHGYDVGNLVVVVVLELGLALSRRGSV